MEYTLHKKNVFIIGGTSGIGYALAQAFLQEQTSVIIQGLTKTERFIKFCRQKNVKGLLYDLRNITDAETLCKDVCYADILCVVYGPFLQKPLDTTSASEWHDTIFANLTVPGMLVSAVLPRMIANKWGRILLFGGTESHILRGFKTNAVYGAAKMGIMSLVRSISMMYAQYGITANAICPGFVHTELLTEADRIMYAEKNPDGELVKLEAIVKAALFLLKDSNYNGVIMPVDKGWSSFYL